MLSRVFPALAKIKVENQFNCGCGDNNVDCGDGDGDGDGDGNGDGDGDGDNDGEILRNKLEMLMALNWTRSICRTTITCLKNFLL